MEQMIIAHTTKNLLEMMDQVYDLVRNVDITLTNVKSQKSFDFKINNTVEDKEVSAEEQRKLLDLISKVNNYHNDLTTYIELGKIVLISSKTKFIVDNTNYGSKYVTYVRWLESILEFLKNK